ncbi:MAG: ABC transporter ATP-binding protein [Anaerolineales bacterium]|nr:ABC transporter ATP-binding protein [Anaerolineales bacterium]
MAVSDAIVISNLSKTYNIAKAVQVQAVKNIHLAIPSGCIFGFLGPNGAGKTTTIKMICGLVRPSAGKITVNQVDVWQKRSSAMIQIGAVLEGTRNIYWTLSAWDNLMYFGHLKGLWGKTLATRAEALLKELELWDRRGELVRIFSRGMQQKVAVACALIADPQVVLLDEPTLGLDVQAARIVKQQIIRLARDFGKTIVLTTHQIEMAQEVCDRIAIIIKGQIIVDQPKAGLLQVFQKQHYQVKVSGILSSEQAMAFREMAIEEKDGVTILSGTVAGPQQLYSLIERLRVLAVPLLSVNRVEPDLEDIFIHFVESQDQYPGAVK